MSSCAVLPAIKRRSENVSPLFLHQLRPVARLSGAAIISLHGEHPAWVFGREGAEPIDPLEIGGIQRYIDSAEIVLQLLCIFRADDDAGHMRLVQQPGERQLCDGRSGAGPDLKKRVDNRVALLEIDGRKIELGSSSV